MARIKVTGWIDTTELDEEEVDLGHKYGLSNEGYERLDGELRSLGLDDVDFALEG